VKEVVVIGLGNPLMTDEAVGVQVVNELKKRAVEFPSVDFEDLGTASARVLHAIAGRHKVIIVDCAYMDLEPGTLVRFTPEEVETRKVQYGLSFHGGDLITTLKLSEALGERPEEVIVFGIQPQDIEQGEELSAPLASHFDEYVAAVTEELDG